MSQTTRDKYIHDQFLQDFIKNINRFMIYGLLNDLNPRIDEMAP